VTSTRRLRSAATVVLLALLGSVLVAPSAGAVVHNIRLKVTSGVLVLGGTEVPVTGDATYVGTWNDFTGAVSGTLKVAPQVVSITDPIPLDIGVTMQQIGKSTGSIDKKTGATRIVVSMRVGLDIAAGCNVSPIKLVMTSAKPGAPFNFNQGTVRVAAKGFNVPAARDCGALTSLINSELGLPTKNTSARFGFKQIANKPSRPRDVAAVPRSKAARVTWKAPQNSGGALTTAYRAVAAPGGRACTTSGARACVVTGLQPGKRYTFTVKAKNFVGWSTASAKSNGVKPKA
jgi:hypothetical protein